LFEKLHMVMLYPVNISNSTVKYATRITLTLRGGNLRYVLGWWREETGKIQVEGLGGSVDELAS
jgi:hypothetical protein